MGIVEYLFIAIIPRLILTGGLITLRMLPISQVDLFKYNSDSIEQCENKP